MHHKPTPDTPCWIWSRGRDGRGYGAIMVGGRVTKAHRHLFEFLIGPIPDGLVLDHLCGMPACVNPDHLEPVTQAENLRRASKLNLEIAREIRADHARGVRMTLIASAYGVSTETVRCIVRNITWPEPNAQSS